MISGLFIYICQKTGFVQDMGLGRRHLFIMYPGPLVLGVQESSSKTTEAYPGYTL